MTKLLQLLAFSAAFAAGSIASAAAGCGFDVYAVAGDMPVKQATKSRTTAEGFRTQIESEKGDWLKGLSPVTVKVTEKGSGYQVYGMRFEIDDDKFCQAGLLIKLTGVCRTEAVVNGARHGTSLPFDVWLAGPRSPSLERRFKAEVC